MQHASPKVAVLALSIFLAACGGGGGSSPTSGGTAAISSAGTTGNNGTGSSTSTPTAALLTAQLTAAPAEGSSINGIVHFEIHGTGIENAELLPPTGYSPILGHFTISADKTAATLDFDTTSLPNGTLQLRISAYNQPAGMPGASETVVMPTRHWTLANTPPYMMDPPPPDPTSIPDASYMPQVLISSTRLPYVDPQAVNDLYAMDDASFNSLVTNNWTQFDGIMRRYVPANVVFDYPTPLGMSAAWSGCFDNHIPTACREAVLYVRGTMLGKQPPAGSGA